MHGCHCLDAQGHVMVTTWRPQMAASQLWSNEYQVFIAFIAQLECAQAQNRSAPGAFWPLSVDPQGIAPQPAPSQYPADVNS